MCLEFKRILENLFEDPDVARSGVVQKYKQHYWKNFHKYRAYRKAFGDHLVKTIENIDSSHLTKCFNSDCKLPDCSEIDNEFQKISSCNDEGPASPVREKKISNGIVQHMVSGVTNSEITDQRPIATVDAESVNSIPREEVKEPKNSQKKEEDVSKSNDVIEILDHSPKKSSTEVTTEIVAEEPKNVESIDTDLHSAPDASADVTQMDTQNDLQIDDNENTASAVNDTADSLDSGPPPAKRLRSTESADEKSNTANSDEEAAAQSENTAEQTLQESDEVEWVNQETGDNADQQTSNENDGSITSKFECRAEDCHESFATKEESTKHYETHTKIYKCSQCTLLFSIRANIFRHFLTHNPESQGQRVSNIQQKDPSNGF